VGKPVRYARICLNGHFQLEKSILTTTPAWFIRITVVALKLALQYVGLKLKWVHNCPFSIHPLRKSNFLSFISRPLGPALSSPHGDMQVHGFKSDLGGWRNIDYLLS
jgi:hypothetical protein